MEITETPKKMQPKTQGISVITHTLMWDNTACHIYQFLISTVMTILKGKCFDHFCACVSILHCDHSLLSYAVHFGERVPTQQMKQKGRGVATFWPKIPLVTTVSGAL